MKKFLKDSLALYLAYMRVGLYCLPVALVWATVTVKWHSMDTKWFLLLTLVVGLPLAHLGYTGWTPVWLHNLWTRFMAGNNRESMFRWGKRIYTFNKWPGYFYCEDLNCGHWWCEHDGPDEICCNAGCTCKGFYKYDPLAMDGFVILGGLIRYACLKTTQILGRLWKKLPTFRRRSPN